MTSTKSRLRSITIQQRKKIELTLILFVQKYIIKSLQNIVDIGDIEMKIGIKCNSILSFFIPSTLKQSKLTKSVNN